MGKFETIDIEEQIRIDEYLSQFYPTPKRDRTEPFVAAKVENTGNNPGCTPFDLPEEAYIDWGLKNIGNRVIYNDGHKLLTKGYLAAGFKVGYTTVNKRPLGSEKTSGYIQGICSDEKFLEEHYEKSLSNSLDWQPAYNSLHTGDPEGYNVLVIDLDCKKGMNPAAVFLPMLAKFDDPASFRTVRTPQGLHIHVAMFDGPKNAVGLDKKIFGPGVDVRTKGGLIIAPGSFSLLSGELRQYIPLTKAPIKPLPPDIIDIIVETSKPKSASVQVPEKLNAENGQAKSEAAIPVDMSAFSGDSQLDIACRIVASQTEGTRNTKLNNCAFAIGKLIREGKIKLGDAFKKLKMAAEMAGLEATEIEKTLQSGLENGIASNEPYVPFDAWGKSVNAAGAAKPLSNIAAQQGKRFPRMDSVVDSGGVSKKSPSPFYRSIEDENFNKHNSYRKGTFGIWADRDGELNDERVDCIIKDCFPRINYAALKRLSKGRDMDYFTGASQFNILTAAALISGKAKLRTGNQHHQEMGPNLLTYIIGASCTGKSTMEKDFLHPVEVWQYKKHMEFLEDFEEYKIAKAQYDKKKKDPDAIPPIRPVETCVLQSDTTTEALVKKASENNGAQWLHQDETAGLRNGGMSKYNKQGEADAQGKITIGHDGGNLVINRKSHDNEQQTINIKNFYLNYTGNIQPELFKRQFRQEDVDQGLVPRFTYIILHTKRAWEQGCGWEVKNEETLRTYSRLDATLLKLLEMDTGRDADGKPEPKTLWVSQEAIDLYDGWYRKFMKYCGRIPKLVPYATRHAEHVARFALTLHYMHWAAECVETGREVPVGEEITYDDIRRAILIGDIFLKRLDEAMWLRSKPENAEVKALNAEQMAFAKHVYANAEFYREPRTSKEIIAQGFRTEMTPKDLTWWLKKQGFQCESVKGRNIRFHVGDLEPWGGSIELERGVFDENDTTPCARAILDNKEDIIAHENMISRPDFNDWIGEVFDHPNPARKAQEILDSNIFLIKDKGDYVEFGPEVYERCRQLLKEDSAVSPPASSF